MSVRDKKNVKLGSEALFWVGLVILISVAHGIYIVGCLKARVLLISDKRTGRSVDVGDSDRYSSTLVVRALIAVERMAAVLRRDSFVVLDAVCPEPMFRGIGFS